MKLKQERMSFKKKMDILIREKEGSKKKIMQKVHDNALHVCRY